MGREYQPYIIMLTVNAAISISGLFVPLLAKDLGLSLSDIGIIGSSYGIASFLSYIVFGRLADILQREKEIVVAGLGIGAVFFGMQIYMRNLQSMIAVRALAGLSVGMCTFPLFSYISRASNYREKVGWLAGFGSLGWAVGYLMAGIVGEWREGFILSGILFLFGFLVSFGLKNSKKTMKNTYSMGKILTSNFPLYLSYFLRHTGAYAVWAIFPVFLREELATPVLWIGALEAINTGSQFWIMGMLGRRGKGWDGRMIFRIGLILSAVAFFLYSVVTSYLQVIPIMLIIAMAWSCMYVGALVLLLEKNVGSSTSTGLLGSTISLAMITGPALGGFISQIAGMRMAGVFAGALSIAGLLCSKFIK